MGEIALKGESTLDDCSLRIVINPGDHRYNVLVDACHIGEESTFVLKRAMRIVQVVGSNECFTNVLRYS
ncbi:hypothetical protein D3C87_1511800 [compost metagenome]